MGHKNKGRLVFCFVWEKNEHNDNKTKMSVFLLSSVGADPLVRAADKTLTSLRVAWMPVTARRTGGARAERKAKTSPQAQIPEERQRGLYPDRKRRVQSKHRMPASVTCEGRRPGGKRSASFNQITACFGTFS